MISALNSWKRDQGRKKREESDLQRRDEKYFNKWMHNNGERMNVLESINVCECVMDCVSTVCLDTHVLSKHTNIDKKNSKTKKVLLKIHFVIKIYINQVWNQNSFLILSIYNIPLKFLFWLWLDFIILFPFHLFTTGFYISQVRHQKQIAYTSACKTYVWSQ